MLVATRDPLLHPGAHPAPPATTGFSRFMNVLQVAGSLLAIPVGLASGYSIYHANFSTEARCQGLRANIVSMLDKSADASTLRMLVRRDVGTFERSCGAVDPNAVAAFKTLLSAGKPVATAAVAQAAAKPAVKEAKAKPVEAKRPTAKPAAREASDAKWLASVRAALVRHRAEPATPVEVARPVLPVVGPVAAVAPSMRAATAPTSSAPALQARVVPVAPAAVAPMSRSEADHPVPPALIPEPTMARSAETPGGTRTGTLLSRVPVIGSMLGR